MEFLLWTFLLLPARRRRSGPACRIALPCAILRRRGACARAATRAYFPRRIGAACAAKPDRLEYWRV